MFIRVVLPAPFSPSRATISPSATLRLTFSLASTPGNCLVIPLSSSFNVPSEYAGVPCTLESHSLRAQKGAGPRWGPAHRLCFQFATRVAGSTPGSVPNRRVVGLDHTVFDVLQDLLHLCLQLIRHLGIPIVVIRQAYAFVTQVTDKGSWRPSALRLLLDCQRDERSNGLLDRREPKRLVFDVHGNVRIGINTDQGGVETKIVDSITGRQIDGATDREAHVAAFLELGLRGLAGQPHVGEATGELTVLGIDIPADDLDIRSLDLVVMASAARESVHEDGHRREVPATVGAQRSGL